MRQQLVLGLAIAGMLAGCVTTHPPSRSDHLAAITIEDLGDWVSPRRLETTLDTLDRKEQLGNTFLSYRYEGHDSEIAVVFNTEIVFAADEQIAKSAYRSFVLGSKIARGEIAQSETAITWGDQTAGGHLLVDDEIRGHVFVGRRGTVVVMAALGGLYREDPGDFERSLAPHLWALTRYDPLGRKIAAP